MGDWLKPLSPEQVRQYREDQTRVRRELDELRQRAAEIDDEIDYIVRMNEIDMARSHLFVASDTLQLFDMKADPAKCGSADQIEAAGDLLYKYNALSELRERVPPAMFEAAARKVQSLDMEKRGIEALIPVIQGRLNGIYVEIEYAESFAR